MKLAWIIFVLIYGALGFNLEWRIPVIKRGKSESYFGYSVAEHQEILENDNKSISWILVGAPLDQNRQPGTNRSGALWQCPLTTNSRDCVQVITDGRQAEDGLIDPNIDSDELIPPGNDEIKDGQWLGVTVRSQGVGGKVMVCAHRHIVKTADSQWGQGHCYILTQDLQYDDLKKPCSGKPTKKAHEQFGYCQAGTSGILTPEDRVVIGTPGPHTWRGTMYVFTVSDEFLLRDNTVYNAPMQDASPVSKYSYLGMSVTVGNFFGKGLAYASGAPRSNGTGQVVVLTRQNSRPDMDVALVLNGEQFASSFGYEIAAADVNGDEITDLIVSAPFYFNKAEGGAVYIYTSLCRHNKDNDKCKPTKLVGREESRFGFALANLRDLNKDGYEDLAIGAPYEGKGTVYIYLGSKNGIITTPSQVIHSEDTPVPLRTFGYSLSGGIDMDKNGYPDLLIGAYDDDAVALLRARKIIDITTSVRYARKDGTYQDKIEAIDPNKFGCSSDPTSNHTCFAFEACCKTESLTRNEGMLNLKLNYHIEAETYSGVKKFSRVWFGFGKNKPHYINRTVTLDPTKLMHCQREIVYLKENTRDIQSPIKFRLNYTLVQEEPIMPAEGNLLPDINNYPILNQQEAARIFEATFQKDCGDNEICESDLQVDAKLNLSASVVKPNFYELLLGEVEEVVVDVNTVNIGESAYEAQLFISHSPSLNYIASKSNESIICNLYNSTLVICSIGNPFRKDNAVNVQVRFDPKGVEDNEPQLNFVIFANSTSKEVQEKQPIRLQAIVLKRAELSIKGSAKTQWAYYGGPVVGESAIKHLNEVGPKVSHMYEVFNEGPWKVRTVEVVISWPYEVANDKKHGKWLLYLEEMPTVSHVGDGECILPPGYVVNPLKLLGSVSYDDLDPFPSTTSSPVNYYRNRTINHIRDRRDIEKVVSTRMTTDRDGHSRQIVSMNCKTGTAKCFDIKCIIYNLQRKQEATITVKARLWNSTLVEDYPKVDQVKIGSNARIVIPPNIEIQQENLKNDQATAETIAYPDLGDQQDSEPVPIWIIIVAICAGLLLLILLTLILWKLGFFKRRRPDPTLSGNLEKHRDDNPEHEALFKH
ncbi:integrin alpha-PS1 isoform X1 [Microplitis mediator]|uniref:integrin alpha-PS1 isoform X1 n=1 Tax=Microplitis mediator TaxID=375433 RepID=UPI002552A07B|nr:integrin alpha-PS1 isoform X1 [Microplitis mediator]XP_057322798.1 integrin alpha-PS1 isoform X1 [Microplitis mediator]XP_057322799.1 integrin alpha-PS1 isoform X1 [Microplitis mediator]